MLDTVLPLISLFLMITTSLIGIYSIVSLIGKKIFDDKLPITVLQILPVTGDGEDVEWKVNALLQRENNVFLLDNGLNENGKKICSILCDTENNVKFFTREDLGEDFIERAGIHKA